MPYTISEQNIERQKLLNKCLSPITDSLLDILELPSGISCLDVGCGIGETTRHLARRLGSSGLMEESEVHAMCDELRRVELEKNVLCISNPVVTVWAKRC